jgi:hypothetical protein
MDDDMDTNMTNATAAIAATAEEKAIMNDINNHIDICVSNNLHYDIALVCYKCLKDKHRYVSKTSSSSSSSDTDNNTWEYLTNAVWTTDVNNKQLIYSIRTIVCIAFTKRSLYWEDERENEKYPDTSVIASKLLQISSKLKDNKYILVLIKECKQFFMI